MIVCICKNVNTAQIVKSVKGGARSLEDVRNETGASSCCGKCQFKVNALVSDYSEENQPAFYDAAATA